MSTNAGTGPDAGTGSSAEAPAAPRAVIIGGGIAGLATSVLLARAGLRVRLLEQHDTLGGRVATVDREGFRFELGPSWYLMPSVFDHFFRLAGTSTEAGLDLIDLAPGYRIFPEPEHAGTPAAPLDVPAGRAAVRRLFESLEPGSGAELDRYLDSAAEASELAVSHFLYNPYTRLTSLLDTRILGRLGTLLTLLRTPLDRHIARRFRHPVLRQLLGYPAVFLGTSPEDAPAIYHLMSRFDLDEGVRYPVGGFAAVVASLEKLARASGVEIVTGARVTHIVTARGRERRGSRRHVTGVRWRGRAEPAQSRLTSAEIVVSCADLHHTETELLEPDAQSYPESWWRERVSGPGAVIIALGVRGGLPELAHHSLFFARDWHENFAAVFGKRPRVPDPASIYVCKPSATDHEVAPPGHENLFILLPVPADPTLGAGRAGDAQLRSITDAVIAQISAWANIPDLRSRIVTETVLGSADFQERYHSWRGGMLGPAHTLRQSAMFRVQNASPKVGGLLYAGATTAPGVGVPMCLISAELVLKRIRGDHSPGPLPDAPVTASTVSPQRKRADHADEH